MTSVRGLALLGAVFVASGCGAPWRREPVQVELTRNMAGNTHGDDLFGRFERVLVAAYEERDGPSRMLALLENPGGPADSVRAYAWLERGDTIEMRWYGELDGSSRMWGKTTSRYWRTDYPLERWRELVRAIDAVAFPADRCERFQSYGGRKCRLLDLGPKVQRLVWLGEADSSLIDAHSSATRALDRARAGIPRGQGPIYPPQVRALPGFSVLNREPFAIYDVCPTEHELWILVEDGDRTRDTSRGPYPILVWQRLLPNGLPGPRSAAMWSARRNRASPDPNLPPDVRDGVLETVAVGPVSYYATPEAIWQARRGEPPRSLLAGPTFRDVAVLGDWLLAVQQRPGNVQQLIHLHVPTRRHTELSTRAQSVQIFATVPEQGAWGVSLQGAGRPYSRILVDARSGAPRVWPRCDGATDESFDVVGCWGESAQRADATRHWALRYHADALEVGAFDRRQWRFTPVARLEPFDVRYSGARLWVYGGQAYVSHSGFLLRFDLPAEWRQGGGNG